MNISLDTSELADFATTQILRQIKIVTESRICVPRTYRINGAIYHKGVKQEAIALPWFYL
jgi:hypothetical protein